MNADGIGSPFHAGEREAQKRAGVQSAGGAIRDFMPDQHRAFFGLLPFLPIATTDQDGWPVATVLTGPTGFLSSPDPKTLRIASLPAASDPAGPHFVPGAPVGILGIDLGTRRRNRANGAIASRDADGLVTSVHQSFGNCPQYIRVREVQPASSSPMGPEFLDGLDEPARTAMSLADTFFVATSTGSTAGLIADVDISLRGGPTGFVRVDGNTLTIPDYRGNRYFNTLGNILLDPRVALLFLDFDTGDLLHVQGKAEVLWDCAGALGYESAERLWKVHVARAWRRRGALPLRWTGPAEEAGA
jgi:predicted pyridoxine 5'-phosphate oxidase superfamily flavin-nucleotide-binding protein